MRSSSSLSTTLNKFLMACSIWKFPDCHLWSSAGLILPSPSASRLLNSSFSASDFSISSELSQNSIKVNKPSLSASFRSMTSSTVILRTSSLSSGKKRPISSTSSKVPSPLVSAALNFFDSMTLRSSKSSISSSLSSPSSCLRRSSRCSSSCTKPSFEESISSMIFAMSWLAVNFPISRAKVMRSSRDTLPLPLLSIFLWRARRSSGLRGSADSSCSSMISSSMSPSASASS
mmetsp:Transcript_95435/g.273728  ORF Transcript_95435/g.273728 Transcript_95435/m.273728 type:complete len:232 (+) Transcript_95435:173-868(+)